MVHVMYVFQLSNFHSQILVGRPLPQILNMFLFFFQGKQGPVEHIYKGVLFIHDRHHLENAGYICVKSQSCVLVGGSRGGIDMNVNFDIL